MYIIDNYYYFNGTFAFFFPPNFWVVSIRILIGVAGHGRCRRSVGGITPSLIHV